MVKAYMKTIEILLVIVISTMFLLVIIPRQTRQEAEIKNYLIAMQKNEDFRSFVTSTNSCYNSTDINTATKTVQGYLPTEYDFIICINNVTTIPDKERMYVNSMVVVGNYSSVNIKKIWIYYWTE